MCTASPLLVRGLRISEDKGPLIKCIGMCMFFIFLFFSIIPLYILLVDINFSVSDRHVFGEFKKSLKEHTKEGVGILLCTNKGWVDALLLDLNKNRWF